MARPDRPTALSDLRLWLERIDRRRIVVWGDLVADCFLHGSTTRVSREAPALVLRYEREEYRAGGAGNAAVNVAALGARARMMGCLGEDGAARELRRILESAGVDTSATSGRTDGKTPTKTRVMAGGVHTVRQQILRIDNDRPWPSADADLGRRVVEAVADADALLVSDYGLGTVTPDAFRTVAAAARTAGIPVVLDSRFALLSYPGVTAATPNEGEVEEALRVHVAGDPEALERAGRELLDRLQTDGVVITRGSAGMAVFQRDRPTEHVPIHGTDEIADVTGAGDTVIAALTCAVAAGAELLEAARLANVAAGLVVLKHGTATVSRAEVEAALGGS